MISLINQDHIDSFSERLKSILNNEIKLGNEINETAKDWPYKNGITVFLRHPFSQRYHCLLGIEYKEINDPHYWKSQYLDTTTNDMLTCGMV